ncbi:tail fiber protein [Virgisporangium ochraceum]
MSEPFLGEIRLNAFDYAPNHWALCNGQLLPIAQNTALFSLLGTYYGGNGISTFGLPDLRGAGPIGFQQGPGLTGYEIGARGGAATVTLTSAHLPAHTHVAMGADVRGTTNTPADATWARAMLGRVRDTTYAAAPDATLMAPDALIPAGHGQPHPNLPPYLTVTFVIALQGLFPPRD